MCDCGTVGADRKHPVQLGGYSGGAPKQVAVLVGFAGLQTGTAAWVTGTDVDLWVNRKHLRLL